MRKLALSTAVLLCLAAAACSKPATDAAAPAAPATAAAVPETAESDMQAVLARHVTAVKAGDVEGVMAKMLGPRVGRLDTLLSKKDGDKKARAK